MISSQSVEVVAAILDLHLTPISNDTRLLFTQVSNVHSVYSPSSSLVCAVLSLVHMLLWLQRISAYIGTILSGRMMAQKCTTIPASHDQDTCQELESFPYMMVAAHHSAHAMASVTKLPLCKILRLPISRGLQLPSCCTRVKDR